jgi:hypothetical protein
MHGLNKPSRDGGDVQLGSLSRNTSQACTHNTLLAWSPSSSAFLQLAHDAWVLLPSAHSGRWLVDGER